MTQPRRRSFSPGASSRGLLLASVVLLALVAPARADVTLREKTVSSGLAGFGNGTSERTLVIAGDKGRSDELSTYTGRFKTLAGGGKPRASATITRLDRELVWTLDPERKQYSEMTFAEMRAAYEAGMAEAQAERDEPRAHDKDVQVDYKLDVQRTGKHEKINGFNAEQVIVTLTATPKDRESGQSAGAYTMTMDQWLSTEVPASAEVTAYYQKFAQKMGLDPRMQGMARGMMAQYGDAVKQLAEKMKELRGYPVRSTMTMGMGGGASLTPEQKAQREKAQADAKKARAEQRQQQEKEADAEANQGAAGSLAGGNVGGAIGGLLGHRLGKAASKKAESSMASGAGSEGAPGGGMTVTTDLVSITSGTAGASFDPPSDYKKVERKQH